MSYYQQYCHKVAEYRLHALLDMDEEMIEKHLSELVLEYGSVRAVTKINSRNPEFKVYVICFNNKDVAEMAAYELGGRLAGQGEVIVEVH